MIANESARTPEEIVAGEEMTAQLDQLLHAFKPQAREAFILFTLEGFTVDEIARITDHPPEQIRKSIEHVRQKIQQQLPENSQFKRHLLHHSHVV